MRDGCLIVILLFCLAGLARCPRDDAEALPMVSFKPTVGQLQTVNDASAQVPWRLYTTCPVDHRNVPVLPSDRRA